MTTQAKTNGGARPGAGRKPGVKSKLAAFRRSIATKALTEDISPLELLLAAMRKAWKSGDTDTAVSCAIAAAPYCHPRLASVKHENDADNPITFTIVTGVPTAQDADPASTFN